MIGFRSPIFVALFAPLALAGCSPSLHDTIGRGDIESVRAMLAEDPGRISDTNALGKQPLQYAVMYAQREAMEALVEAGADLNARDNTGMTALHVAAMYGRKGPIRWLVSRGADALAVDDFGDRPSHLAAIYGQADAVALLHESGDDLRGRNKNGMTPLDLAIKHRRREAADRIRALIGEAGDSP